MGDGPIRLLVVDDSTFMRVAVRTMLEPADDIVVVGEATNGAEALRLARKLKPHVIAMDLNMPVMDGIEAVQAIAREKGPPSIMVSNDTSAGAAATIRALEAGAVDFVCKAGSFVSLDATDSIDRQLLDKVRRWGHWRRVALSEVPPPPPAPLPVGSPCRAATVAAPRSRPDLVVIGVSTGGPVALAELIGALGPAPCPIVVAQHMPSSFTGEFAASLARTLGRRVVEGPGGAVVEDGAVTILRGGGDTVVERRPNGRFGLRTVIDSGEPHHPSANLLLRSAAEQARLPVAVLLTGMGEDGRDGAAALFGRGCPVLVQDPASCAVDGMPRAAIRAGVASEVLSIAGIARRLDLWFTL